jgi:hypothetical protein
MALKDTRTGQDVTVVIIANGDVLRAADGKHLGWFDASGDVVYSTAAYVDDVYLGKNGAAHRLHLEDGKLVAKPLWHRVDDKRRRLVGHKSYISLIGTPSGFITTNGLWDVTSGKTLRDELGGLPGHKYVAGCVSLDGQYIWRSAEIGNDAITLGLSKLDGGGTGLGLIVEGRQPQAVRQAAIDRFGMSRIHMGWCHPTAFGNRVFVRTNAYMYCFGKGEWRPAGRSE